MVTETKFRKLGIAAGSGPLPAALAEAAQPFLKFGWRIIDTVRAAREEQNQ